MKIEIKRTKDHRIISKLNESVQNLHHKLYPNEFKKFDLDAVSSFFKKELNQSSTYAFVATINSEAVGYLLCMLKTRNESEFQFEKKLLYIDQISINNKFRNQGIGKELMHRAIELANDLQVTEIQLDHWVDNSEAAHFFKQLGFRYYNFKMRR